MTEPILKLPLRVKEESALIWDADKMLIAEALDLNMPKAWKQAAELARRANAFDELLAALKGIMGDIESGLLVRDITRDGSPQWATQMLGFVNRLNAAKSAIASAEKETI